VDRFDWLELDSTPGYAAPKAAAPGSRHAPAVRRMPTDAPSFYQAAREMRHAGHFGAAVDFYRRAVGFDDHLYAARVELIDTLVRGGRLDEADAASIEAVENYRQVRVLYASRALALAHRKRMEEALSYSEASLDGNDASWYATCVRGEILIRQDVALRFEAETLFERATSQATIPWEPQFIAGWVFLDARQYALAAAHFADAAHWNPRAPLCWLCLGDAFRELRLYEQAMFYYQRVIEIEPANELALERQKACAPLIYGLMRLLRKDTLHERWRKEVLKALGRGNLP
jgi:tetratricopeptide (TPR) repeat protein